MPRQRVAFMPMMATFDLGGFIWTFAQIIWPYKNSTQANVPLQTAKSSPLLGRSVSGQRRRRSLHNPRTRRQRINRDDSWKRADRGALTGSRSASSETYELSMLRDGCARKAGRMRGGCWRAPLPGRFSRTRMMASRLDDKTLTLARLPPEPDQTVPTSTMWQGT